MNTHTFALYYNGSLEQKSLVITDRDMLHRLQHVLRVQPGTFVQLFNKRHVITGCVQSVSKKQIYIFVEQRQDVVPAFARKVTILLPVLKSEFLHQAMYNLTEIGVYTIQLIVTEKTQGRFSEKVADKLHKISIAAAEQSKNFYLPILKSPISLQQALKKIEHPFVLCDEQGESVHQVYQNSKQYDQVTVCVGPEAGFTQQEHELLNQYQPYACKLTRTVLRAVQAVTIAGANFVV